LIQKEVPALSAIVGILGIFALLVLLFLGMNIGFAMLAVGFFGFTIVRILPGALGHLMTIPFSTAGSFPLSVIPLFVLMGQFAFYSGLSEDLYKACHKWLGRLPGGLAVATVGACGCFASICGSSTATAATMGTVCIPEMRRYRYAPSLTTGCVAAGGTLGILIPPSVGFILYGVIAQQSIGALFAAGLIPGIMLMVLYMLAVVVQAVRNPKLGPPGETFTLSEKLQSITGVLPILALFLLVIGGMFLGFFTANEGAAIGALGSFLFMVSRGKCTWNNFRLSLSSTVKTTCMIFLIMIGTNMFGFFLTISKLPAMLASAVPAMDISPHLVLILILLIYLALGCVMDSLAMVLLLVPIFLPVVTSLGMDLIWFGVLMVMIMEAGLITPPVGMNVFVIKGVAGDVPLGTIFRGVTPFIVALIVAVALVIVFPGIALWLPGILEMI
jgi:tripartite ATP-independent transporter DctM subunit